MRTISMRSFGVDFSPPPPNEQSTDAMEAEARRRGLDKSDLLLIFMLKANRPDKFRERQESQHTGEVTIRVIREDRPIDRPAE